MRLPRAASTRVGHPNTSPVWTARDAHAPHAGLASTLLVVGGSGRRYALHAVHTEGNAAGAVLTVVTITPLQSVNGSAALAMRYGLSAREQAVLLRVAHGESTKAIAAALQLSAYTVRTMSVARASEWAARPGANWWRGCSSTRLAAEGAGRWCDSFRNVVLRSRHSSFLVILRTRWYAEVSCPSMFRSFRNPTIPVRSRERCVTRWMVRRCDVMPGFPAHAIV